jgi:hypothetical protein
MRAFLVGAFSIALAGCGDPLVVNCTSDAMCTRNGTQGHCTASTVSSSKFCAFSDSGCGASGRWDPTAGDSLAGTCVGGSNGGDGFINMKDGGANPDLGPNITWTKEISGVTDWLFGIWGSGPNDIYVGGQISKAILHNDGTGTWTKQFLPVDNSINTIWGTGAKDVWAGSDSGILYHSAGDGNWTMMQSPSMNNINYMWGIGMEIWSVGDSGDVMHYTPATGWMLQPVPATCQDTMHGLWGSDNLHLTAVGYGGLLCSTVDGGKNWLYIGNTGATSQQNLAGIWGSPDKNLFIPSDAGAIYRSTNNGGAWKLDTTPTTDDLFGVWGNTANDAYIVGGNPGSTILHWDGTKWNEQMSGVQSGLNGIWASGPTDYYVIGLDGTILHGPPK